MRWFLLVMAAAATTAAAQTTEMYRTVGADGSVTFSDTPLNNRSELITVLVRSGTTAPGRPAGRTAETNEPAATEPAAAGGDSLEEQVATNCTRAREHQQGIQNSNRLYRVLADGEREFLTPEEVTEAREQAARDVARWCESTG